MVRGSPGPLPPPSQVHLNTAATSALLAGYDEVLLATGVVPRVPDIPGILLCVRAASPLRHGWAPSTWTPPPPPVSSTMGVRCGLWFSWRPRRHVHAPAK